MKNPPLMFAAPTAEILGAIAGLGVDVVECGAGDGAWLRAMRERGIDCIGFDIDPRGDGVGFGSHLEAAKHPERALLMVWPPTYGAQEWIDAYRGQHVLLCAAWPRIKIDLSGWDRISTLKTTGKKGGSEFVLLRRH